jgi:hypothetical protein
MSEMVTDAGQRQRAPLCLLYAWIAPYLTGAHGYRGALFATGAWPHARCAASRCLGLATTLIGEVVGH